MAKKPEYEDLISWFEREFSDYEEIKNEGDIASVFDFARKKALTPKQADLFDKARENKLQREVTRLIEPVVKERNEEYKIEKGKEISQTRTVQEIEKIGRELDAKFEEKTLTFIRNSISSRKGSLARKESGREAFEKIDAETIRIGQASTIKTLAEGEGFDRTDEEDLDIVRRKVESLGFEIRNGTIIKFPR